MPASGCRGCGRHAGPIVEHADVRRMLLTMRAQIAAMRALAYWTAASSTAASAIRIRASAPWPPSGSPC